MEQKRRKYFRPVLHGATASYALSFDELRATGRYIVPSSTQLYDPPHYSCKLVVVSRVKQQGRVMRKRLSVSCHDNAYA